MHPFFLLPEKKSVCYYVNEGKTKIFVKIKLK